MQSAPMGRVTDRHHAKRRHRPEGFSLLEMMMVVTVVLIVASIATPIYMTCVVWAREAVLRDHLFSLRSLIDRFTLDPADAGPRSCLAPRNRGKRLSGKSPDRPLHRIKRDLAGDKGRHAPLTNANGAGDCGRTQRLEPAFPRRHPVQHLVAQVSLSEWYNQGYASRYSLRKTCRALPTWLWKSFLPRQPRQTGPSS